MIGIAALLRGFGGTVTVIEPAEPTIAVTNNADGTVTLVITESDDNAANGIYSALYSLGTLEFEHNGDITGNGSLTIDYVPGTYIFRVTSIIGSASTDSNVIIVTVTSGAGAVAPITFTGDCNLPSIPSIVVPTGSSGGGMVVRPLTVGSNCFFNCDQTFANIRVTPTIKRGSLIEFELHPSFTDPGPYVYQLQVGRTASNDADDWEVVGLNATNVSHLVDDTVRLFGKTSWIHYRVCLSTPLATYISRPENALGILDFRDRRLIVEMLKAQHINLKQSEGVEGFLLKRRLFGTKCDNDCVDFLTGEVINSQCPYCFGTGFLQGYFSPIPCIYAALERKVSHNELDGGQSRGTVNDAIRVKARMLAIPQVFEEDFWVDKKNDHRWYIHKIEHAAEYKGIPVAADVEFRFAPFSDSIYDIEMPNEAVALAT